MNYPSARDEFDRLMKLQYPEGRPRGSNPIERQVNPELQAAIAEIKAAKSQAKAEKEQAEVSGEVQ